MLGIDRLFEEEENCLSTTTTGSSSATKNTQHGCTASGPPSARPQSGLCGIKNQGATCYLNALLQTLLYTPEFREALFRLDSTELGCLEDREKPGSRVRVIPIQLQNLFSRLLLLDQASVSTTHLTDSFGWTGSEEFQQHDVQELNRILFSAIEDSLVGTSGEKLIQNLYKGSIVNTVTCEECGRVSERTEDFFDLTAAVANYNSLQDFLTSSYLETERFEGRNKYKCAVCNKLVNAVKGAKLRSLPPILSVSLLRFSFDYEKLQRYKETGKYTFPLQLDLSMFCEKEENEGTTLYELYSVVIHRGSCYGGHYHAYIKDIDGLGQWKSPVEDYSVIQPKKNLEKQEDKLDFSSPMECLSMILALQGGPGYSMAVDKLCQALIQTTGVSWNKQFKKQYGTVTKFLKKYNDIFRLDPNSNIVSLQTNDKQHSPGLGSHDGSHDKHHSPGLESHDKQSHDTQSHGTQTYDDAGQNVTEKEVRKQNLGNEETLNKPSSMGNNQCWFDFNDSYVKPINEREIKNQFAGRESAYMLFYRRKSLQRPKEAFGNPGYGLPMSVIQEVSRLNSELTTKRIEHDVELNTIKLLILQSQYYEYRLGSLHLKNDMNSCVTALNIDRRRDVADLIIAIQEVLGEGFLEGSQLSIAKDLPAGLHLYQMISQDPSSVINDVGLVQGSQLFLWNGNTIGGHALKTGEQTEPVLLNITFIDGNGTKQQVSHAFPKHCQFREVRLMISRFTEIQPDFLLISRQLSKTVIMAASDDKLSLQELKLLDCDNISAEAKTRIGKPVIETVAKPQEKLGCVKVQVENRCTPNPDPDGDWPIIQVETESSQMIEKLKMVILKKVGLTGNLRPDGGGRLRICSETVGCQPPLFELQSVGAAEIKHNSCLILEPGAPPKHNQITISFSLGTSKESNGRKEMIVNKTITVDKCLNLILVEFDLKGQMYHLQKTNWLGETAEALDDLNATLDQENVKDGDNILVQPGKLAPRGFLNLPVWMYPSPYIPHDEEDTGILNWITTLMKGLFNGVEEEDESLSDMDQTNVFLDNIEISQETSVDTLKTLILNQLNALNMSVPSTHHLRLRQVENSVLTKVFRNNEQTLRRQKINSTTKLAVQILPEEETLKQNTIVLVIRRRNVALRTYNKSEELIWDTTRSLAPEPLKQVIAERLKIPVERLVIAKQQPEKFTWIVIPNSSFQRQKNVGQKGKNKGSQKNQKLNLKHAPYQLKDGDVIGVKDTEDDPENIDDFSTQEDEQGREKLRQIAEAKRKMRQESKERNSDDLPVEKKKNKKERRKEVALVIKVDDFK